ncbi:nitroreductase [Asticcacaulis sp. AC402]|uniref:nitroreductase family protein n=1 Tax=Asticcacaulis sp. AC402 TaxID=1282361 RepID=UPI0003C3D3FC|nr:nitroreductase [Asticcacaulis sp. AC402]ESQ76598.1 NAD(P)H nitroreductase [Asticcacaulis sp. AC402]
MPLSDRSLALFDTPAPEFGQPLPQKPSADMLEALFFRRSASAPTLRAPGPSPEEMDLLIRLGLRVPDHGKIGPWRLVRFTPQSKTALVEKLKPLAVSQPEPAKALAALQKLAIPPEALLVVSSPLQPHKIPLWEQQLSAAAVCQTLLIAAGALGYGANWITDWYSYDAVAKALLGLAEHENVAGFIYLGTPSEAPLERDRPNFNERISYWTAGD